MHRALRVTHHASPTSLASTTLLHANLHHQPRSTSSTRSWYIPNLSTSMSTQHQTSLRSNATAAAGPMVNDEDPLVMYIVLRRDLWQEQQWPLGSIVSQGCHAATAVLWDTRESEHTQAYCAPSNLDHMRKVTLEVKSEAQLHTLSSKLTDVGIAHKLWVEQPENYATCIATAPAPRSHLQPLMKKLQLCRGWPYPVAAP